MESVKQPIVDMILWVIASTPPVFVNGKEDLNRARLASQLINDGYLRGSVASDSQGRPMNVAILDVTIQGRTFCEQLEEEIRNARFAVKAVKTLKKGTILLLAGIGGVIGAVIGSVITAIILKKTGMN